MAGKVKKINLKPVGDRVLIRPITLEEKTESGIILPDTVTKERPEEGEILAVGPGALDENGKRVPLEVKVGQRVMFTKYGPNEIKVGEEELLIVKESDIMAIIE